MASNSQHFELLVIKISYIKKGMLMEQFCLT
jgi:hypothetical protein